MGPSIWSTIPPNQHPQEEAFKTLSSLGPSIWLTIPPNQHRRVQSFPNPACRAFRSARYARRHMGPREAPANYMYGTHMRYTCTSRRPAGPPQTTRPPPSALPYPNKPLRLLFHFRLKTLAQHSHSAFSNAAFKVTLGSLKSALIKVHQTHNTQGNCTSAKQSETDRWRGTAPSTQNPSWSSSSGPKQIYRCSAAKGKKK